MLIVLNMTVIPQFQQLYATMNVQLSTLQNILTVFITKLPAFVLLLTFCSIVIYIIIYKLLNKIPINKKIKYIVEIPLSILTIKYSELIKYLMNSLFL